MSDSYRKDFKRRNEYGGGSKDYSSPGRGRGSRSDKDAFSRRQPSFDKPSTQPPPPTILIKTRETERATSPGVSSTGSSARKDPEHATAYQIQTKTPTIELLPVPDMTSAVPLLSGDLSSVQDACQPFLLEQSDFLVVGCLGMQGVGKSTIMSLLAQPNLQCPPQEKTIFRQQTCDDEACGRGVTSGIDVYITCNRIILLDCQATLSAQLPSYSGGEDTNNNAELQSLQLAAFLFSVCHVVLFVQEYFIDPDLIRFLQTAEMLKPSTSTAIGETIVEYFPHLVFLHNKAADWEFEAAKIKQFQEGYLKILAHSRLQIQTGFGIANGDVSPVLDTKTCGPLINLFLLPNFSSDGEIYTGHPSFKDLFRHLRNQVLSTPRTPISHSLLTEKNWLLYAGKVWEGIQKSSFFKEYHRLISAI